MHTSTQVCPVVANSEEQSLFVIFGRRYTYKYAFELHIDVESKINVVHHLFCFGNTYITHTYFQFSFIFYTID